MSDKSMNSPLVNKAVEDELDEEDRQEDEQQPGELVPLLRGERRPFTRLARLGDRQGHGVLRLWMKDSGPSTHKE